jgi:SAM-dependent methyltransferase
VTTAAPHSDDAIAAAAQRSPLREGPAMSSLADMDELKFREEVEPYPDPVRDVMKWIDGKELPTRLAYDLGRLGVKPHGTVVELGAGACWLGSELARRPEVEKVIGVEFSRRRLVELAPIAMAYLQAPPEKIERVLADFYEPGIESGSADMVFTDAAFHHAPEPVRLARLAHDLLKPGGLFVLMREPTLSLLNRSRPHGLEGEHGDFEREYDARDYLRFLEEAGFEAWKARAGTSFSDSRGRMKNRPPLSWLNGIAWSMYSYAGRKPSN